MLDAMYGGVTTELGVTSTIVERCASRLWRCAVWITGSSDDRYPPDVKAPEYSTSPDDRAFVLRLRKKFVELIGDPESANELELRDREVSSRNSEKSIDGKLSDEMKGAGCPGAMCRGNLG